MDLELRPRLTALMRWAAERSTQLGQQGWEMVSHTQQGMPAQGGFTHLVTVFFKRRIPN
jgi:shikimate 5-dehydrogenase